MVLRVSVIVAFVAIIVTLGMANGRRKKYFTYTINNQLEEPFFHESMKLELVNKKPLIYYMEKAVLTNSEKFTRFKATCLKVFNGYFINSINGREGFWYVNQTYWHIFNSTGSLELGVSSYIPSPNDQVLFNFTMGNPHAS